MKPSFLTSTLSLAFIICIVSVIIMIFLGIDPNEKLIGLISWVIGAYVGSRLPNDSKDSRTQQENKWDELDPKNPALD